MSTKPKYYIVEASALPEVFLKVAEAKRLLSTGEASTVNEATRMTDISRSAFYKYRDAVLPFQSMMTGRIITFQLLLHDEQGLLSEILGVFADAGANISTINSIVPTNGTAVGVGIVLIVFTAFVIFGGAKRISIITSIIVPIMAIAYILIALWTTIANIGELPAVFGTIFQSAFNFQSIAGGFAGSVVMLGIKRGLFSNEAGMGSAPNAAATASVSHPVKQGLVQSLSVYIDTLLICTCSAMMVMVFWVQDPEAAMALNGMPLVQMAVNNAVGEVGIHFITFAIFAFAFSSLIGNYFYAETNFRYIFKNTKWGMLIFRVLCLAAIFYGCVNSFDLAWNLADIFMGFMAIINLVAILLLGKWALAALDDYTRQRKEGKDPVFIAASVPGMPACECWTTADLPNFGDNPVEEYIEEAASLDSEGLR